MRSLAVLRGAGGRVLNTINVCSCCAPGQVSAVCQASVSHLNL